MLVLTRKLKESLIIGDNIEVTIVDIRGDQVRLGVAAPRNIGIYRKEIYDKLKEANIDSVKQKKDRITIPVITKGGDLTKNSQGNG